MKIPRGVDWKGVGYLLSILGAVSLGAIAWPKPDDPAWHLPVLLAGVALTILGYGVRYLAHLKQKREIAETRREARTN